MTRRKASPARTISPNRSGGRPSTIRPNAASSARSGSGSTIGRSCARSGARGKVMAKRKARISDETFDEFLAPQRILGACEQRAIKEIIVEQLAEAIVVPCTPIHPGEHLDEELRELGITAT